MKKILTCLFAALGLTTACAQGNYETDVFKTKSGKTVTFHALVHASIRIQYDGKEIQIDPVRKLGNKVIDYAAMPKADYLFVTHEHGDHFDKEAIKLLAGKNTQLVMNKRCAEMYDGKCAVFVTRPTPPYNEKDLWINAVWPDTGNNVGATFNNDILRCVHGKNENGTFDIGDWTLASKYTDNSALEQFESDYYDTL